MPQILHIWCLSLASDEMLLWPGVGDTTLSAIVARRRKLGQAPPRVPYYPGSDAKAASFCRRFPDAETFGDTSGAAPPWRLKTGLTPDQVPSPPPPLTTPAPPSPPHTRFPLLKRSPAKQVCSFRLVWWAQKCVQVEGKAENGCFSLICSFPRFIGRGPCRCI